MDHAKLLDVLTSLPVSHAILPRVVCFATSRQANHALCSFLTHLAYRANAKNPCYIKRYSHSFEGARKARTS